MVHAQGGVPRTMSLDPQSAGGSRLQHSSSLAGGAELHMSGAIRRAATISNEVAADFMLQQPGQQAVSSAPGAELAMYRAAGRLLPLNLNYMPTSLTKLVLSLSKMVYSSSAKQH